MASEEESLVRTIPEMRDESGSHIGRVRSHGLALRNRGNATPRIAAIALDGIRSMMTIEGKATAGVLPAVRRAPR